MRLNIGDALERWKQLRARKDFKRDAEEEGEGGDWKRVLLLGVRDILFCHIALRFY